MDYDLTHLSEDWFLSERHSTWFLGGSPKILWVTGAQSSNQLRETLFICSFLSCLPLPANSFWLDWINSVINSQFLSPASGFLPFLFWGFANLPLQHSFTFTSDLSTWFVPFLSAFNIWVTPQGPSSFSLWLHTFLTSLDSLAFISTPLQVLPKTHLWFLDIWNLKFSSFLFFLCTVCKIFHWLEVLWFI